MFVFFYLMIMSFTYLLVQSEGGMTCDCSEIGILKEMMEKILSSNDRIEKVEQKLEGLEIKVNNTIATAKEKQEGFGRNIGAIVKKALNSEKKERTRFVSNMKRSIVEHKESLEAFKVALNHTIDERFKNITAFQNEHSHDIKETLGVFENSTADAFSNVLNNISTFQEIITVDVNRRLDIIEQVNKSIQLIATNLNNVNQSVNETRYMIDALGKSVEEDKDEAVNGQWTSWTAWGPCFGTCGGGIKKRTRSCTNPAPFGYGRACIGNSVDEDFCIKHDCQDSIEKIEQKIEGLEIKVNHTITTAKEKQEGFGRNIGTIVKKALNSEKKERTRFVSNMKRSIVEHKKSLEAFKVALNNTIDERFKNITAFQNEHTHDIKETLGVFENSTSDAFSNVLNNMSTFQEIITVDVNRRLERIEQLNKSIQFIATDLNALNQNVNETRYMIDVLGESVEEGKDRKEKLEQKFEDLELKVSNTITTAKEKPEGFHRNIGAVVKKALTSEKKERANFVSSMNKKLIEHKEGIDTFKLAVNSTIDKRFENITAVHNEHSHDVEEALAGFKNLTANAFSNVLNNISKFQEEIILDVNRRLDGIEQVNKSNQFIATDLNTVNESVQMTRYMIEALSKSVEEDKVWSSWSAWGECSAPCNAGLRGRDRRCTSKFGCIGSSKDFSLCNTHNCEDRVRLVNGNNFEGRLEVLYGSAWGTVCDDSFDEKSATVVCKMLNLPSTTPRVYSSAYFGMGFLQILLDDVECKGTESSLFSCKHNGIKKHNCQHSEDVGISCLPKLHIRLVGGSSSRSGRVEVSVDGSNWGTVCDDSFTNESAKVVCRMLGYPTSNARYDTSVSEGNGNTFLDDVSCIGTESTLSDCKHSVWRVENCSPSEDVGVICS